MANDPTPAADELDEQVKARARAAADRAAKAIFDRSLLSAVPHEISCMIVQQFAPLLTELLAERPPANPDAVEVARKALEQARRIIDRQDMPYPATIQQIDVALAALSPPPRDSLASLADAAAQYARDVVLRKTKPAAPPQPESGSDAHGFVPTSDDPLQCRVCGESVANTIHKPAAPDADAERLLAIEKLHRENPPHVKVRQTWKDMQWLLALARRLTAERDAARRERGETLYCAKDLGRRADQLQAERDAALARVDKIIKAQPGPALSAAINAARLAAAAERKGEQST